MYIYGYGEAFESCLFIRTTIQMYHYSLEGKLYNNTSLLPPPPRNHPHRNRRPYTKHASHRPETKASPTKTLAPAIHGISIDCILVAHGIHKAPKGGSGGRHHSDNPPVCAKVFDTPDNRDDNRHQREGGAVAEADECGCGVE